MDCLSLPSFIWIPSTSKYEKHSNHQKKFRIAVSRRDTDAEFSLSFSCFPSFNAIHKTVPLAASIAIFSGHPLFSGHIEESSASFPSCYGC
ncbi:hypothetical protein HN873_066226 [Arachis hypogaea]